MTTSDQLQPANAVEIRRGSSKTLQLAVVDADGDPIDLAGAKVYFTVKETIDDQEALIAKSSNNPDEITILNPSTQGLAQIYLVPADTQNLEVQDYIFDAWVVLSTGKRYPVIVQSTFSVLPTVTRIPL